MKLAPGVCTYTCSVTGERVVQVIFWTGDASVSVRLTPEEAKALSDALRSPVDHSAKAEAAE